MEIPSRFDKRGLLEQLDNYKLIIQVNSELLEEDQLLKEQVRYEMGRIESQLDEMNTWENINEQTKYRYSLDEANRILDTLKNLIEQMLGDDDLYSEDSLQSLN
jgi:hypothetical protein